MGKSKQCGYETNIFFKTKLTNALFDAVCFKYNLNTISDSSHFLNKVVLIHCRLINALYFLY